MKIRCHYEVLGVARTANDSELKKSYRKLVLRWHPDKNLNNAEEADKRFKEIQTAYEILSDKNERKWYDDHRDSILQGIDAFGSTDSESSILPNIWVYFTPTCYQDFTDSDEGFYKTYDRIFTEINQVEKRNDETHEFLPSFGISSSNDEKIKIFYRSWSGFICKLSFGWCDIGNPNDQDMPRYHRRHIQKLNNKAREKEKKKYVDSVRALVDFVKKRDPRMKKIVKIEEEIRKEKTQKVRKREIEKQNKKQLEREKLRLAFEEELKLRQVEEDEMGEKYFKLADEKEEENNIERISFKCKVCNKSFKSEKQLGNHKKSKKHKEEEKKILKQKIKNTSKKNIQQKQQQQQKHVKVKKKVEIESISSSSNSDSDSDSDSSVDFGAFLSKSKKTEVEESDSEEEVESVISEKTEDKDQVVELKEVLEMNELVEPIENDDDEVVNKVVVEENENENEGKDVVSLSKNKKKKKKISKNHVCETCEEAFKSRNRLFQHIKQTKHAALK